MQAPLDDLFDLSPAHFGSATSNGVRPASSGCEVIMKRAAA